MKLKLQSVSLLWRILFSTSIAITVLFAAMGWLLQDQFVRIASATLGEEARASFRAYESLWKARGDQLASISLILSRLPSVRSAFGTGDGATIRDSASEVWMGFTAGTNPRSLSREGLEPSRFPRDWAPLRK